MVGVKEINRVGQNVVEVVAETDIALQVNRR